MIENLSLVKVPLIALGMPYNQYHVLCTVGFMLGDNRYFGLVEMRYLPEDGETEYDVRYLRKFEKELHNEGHYSSDAEQLAHVFNGDAELQQAFHDEIQEEIESLESWKV